MSSSSPLSHSPQSSPSSAAEASSSQNEVFGTVAQSRSAFVDAVGFKIDDVTPTTLTGHVDFSADHHTPWGVVHGGVYTSIVESAGSVGASLAVHDRGQYTVGVHNATDFLRPARAGRARVNAEALFQGRTQQLWDVVITDDASGKVLARGQLRVHNVDLPTEN